MIAPPLFLVPFTFLTRKGQSNLINLYPPLWAKLLLINIPVTLLSSNTFTVLPLCIFIFSIPIFIHTSFKGLNVCLTSLPFPFFYTAFWLTVPTTLLGSVIPALPFWALGTIHSTFSPQFHQGVFFPVLQGRQKIFPFLFLFIFSPTTVSFPPQVLHFTLSALLFLASLSL